MSLNLFPAQYGLGDSDASAVFEYVEVFVDGQTEYGFGELVIARNDFVQ